MRNAIKLIDKAIADDTRSKNSELCRNWQIYSRFLDPLRSGRLHEYEHLQTCVPKLSYGFMLSLTDCFDGVAGNSREKTELRTLELEYFYQLFIVATAVANNNPLEDALDVIDVHLDDLFRVRRLSPVDEAFSGRDFSGVASFFESAVEVAIRCKNHKALKLLTKYVRPDSRSRDTSSNEEKLKSAALKSLDLAIQKKLIDVTRDREGRVIYSDLNMTSENPFDALLAVCLMPDVASLYDRLTGITYRRAKSQQVVLDAADKLRIRKAAEAFAKCYCQYQDVAGNAEIVGQEVELCVSMLKAPSYPVGKSDYEFLKATLGSTDCDLLQILRGIDERAQRASSDPNMCP